jgi:hypothetical protein
VLYEGRQIYFGAMQTAKAFFIDLGFECPPRQTTGDFLTSLTNPAERVVRKGFEGKTPHSPDEFAAAWRGSLERTRLLQEIEDFDMQYAIGGTSLQDFKQSRKALQAKSQCVVPLLPIYAHTDPTQACAITVYPFSPDAGQPVYDTRLSEASRGHGCYRHWHHL